MNGLSDWGGWIPAAVGQVKGSNFQAKFPKITYFHEGHRQTGCLSEDLQMTSAMRSDIRNQDGKRLQIQIRTQFDVK